MVARKEEDGVITDEELQRLRSRIGKTFVPKEPFYNTQATRDAIRHYCNGIGDVNPLYRDREYAKKTKYGDIIAPPLFIFSAYWMVGGGGLPGVHGWHSGSDITFHRIIRLDDDISYTETLTDVVEKPRTHMSRRLLFQYCQVPYVNQNNEVIADRRTWTARAERSSTRETGKYLNITKATYTNEELQAIYDLYDREEIRGAVPRYWEDVKVGDELPTIVKGPLRLIDIVTWVMGTGSIFYKAHKIAHDYQKRHPGATLTDLNTGVTDIPELVHLSEGVAKAAGLPNAYDYGAQRACWLAQLITNWMGDDGFLKKFYYEIRSFNYVGDATWCYGKVVQKRVENGEHLVDLELWAKNQRGEITAPGKATVVLPAKQGQPDKPARAKR